MLPRTFSCFKRSKNKKEVVSLDDLFAKIKSGQKEINVVLKADVRGSEEAVKSSLEKIDVEGVRVKVIRSGIGTLLKVMWSLLMLLMQLLLVLMSYLLILERNSQRI